VFTETEVVLVRRVAIGLFVLWTVLFFGLGHYFGGYLL
jgi:hypothetical protein